MIQGEHRSKFRRPAPRMRKAKCADAGHDLNSTRCASNIDRSSTLYINGVSARLAIRARVSARLVIRARGTFNAEFRCFRHSAVLTKQKFVKDYTVQTKKITQNVGRSILVPNFWI